MLPLLDEIKQLFLPKSFLISYNYPKNIRLKFVDLRHHFNFSNEELQDLVVGIMTSIMGYTNILQKFLWIEDTFKITWEEVLTVIFWESILLGMNLKHTLLPNVLFWKKCLRLKHKS